MAPKRKQVDLAALGYTEKNLTPANQENIAGFSPEALASLGLTGGAPGQRQTTIAGTLPQQNLVAAPQSQFPQNYTSAGQNALGSRELSVGAVTPQEQLEVQDYFNDPKAFINQKQTEEGGLFDKARNVTGTFLSNLFNTEDRAETFVESAWDGMLKGLNWMYNGINQITTAGLSGLPGGIRTLTWDEAGDVSFGQAMVTNNAQLRNQVADLLPDQLPPPIKTAINLNTFGGAEAFGNIASMFMEGPEGSYNPLIEGSYTPLYMRKTFDITDPEQRRQAFEVETQGKYASGMADLVFTVFADPFIIGGKFLKLSRIKWVDRPVISKAQQDNLAAELAADSAKLQAGQTDQLSGMGTFLNWVTAVDDKGLRARTHGEIYNHPVVRQAAARDELTDALMNADNFDDAALLMRVAYNDTAAKAELISKRADLALQLGEGYRRRLEILTALNPGRAARMRDTSYTRTLSALDTVTELERKYKTFLDDGLPDPPDLAKARQVLHSESDNLRAIQNGMVPSMLTNPATKDELALVRQGLNEMQKRDRFLARATSDDVTGALSMSQKGFGGDNIVGRIVERSRERRAAAAWESASTSKLGYMAPDEYYKNNRLVRTVRFWRRPGQETPSGYAYTKGAPASDTGREVMANLNSVGVYAGTGVEKTINGKTVIIGGIDRKNQLIARFFAAVGTNVDDQAAVQKALMAMEQEVFTDIAMANDIPIDIVRQLVSKFNTQRESLRTQIIDQHYWAEIDPSGNISKSKAAWLESQLQNGMYLMDFGLAERLASSKAADGLRGVYMTSRDMAMEKLGNGYEIFNELWRPAVLLRLGYTQRNVFEGVFRSAAYLSSLAPLGYVAQQIGYGIRNPIVRQQVQAEYNRVAKLIDAGSPTAAIAGGKFGTWRKTQSAAIIDRIAKEEQWLDDQIDLMKNSGLSRAELDDAYRNLFIHQKSLDELRIQKEMLLDDTSALVLYRKQASAKRRVFDGFIDGAEPSVWKNAFAADSDYTPLALMNSSADKTTQQMLAVKMGTAENIFKAIQQKYYVEVVPADGDRYFDGVAQMLVQFKNSEMGDMILRGATPKEVAAFLRTPGPGLDIAKFINGGGEFKVTTFDEAEQYAEMMIERLNKIAPSPELRRFVAGTKGTAAGDVSPITGADVKRFLDNDQYRPILQPAIGNQAVDLGYKTIRTMYGSFVGKAFEWLGTIPENAFVRTPFYGRRYRDTVLTMRNNLQEQFGDRPIPMTEVNRIIRNAHRQALRDTKSTLYTIERRTKLGSYGEYVFPFISATQNSITALGRLIYNDPSIPGILALIWSAPNRAGLEDEQGNIRIMIPKDKLPKGMLEAVGLQNMTEFKFAKGQLNVIFPETGYGFIPRPGPLVAATSSELMKHGFFGYSVEAPDVLQSVFGKETADGIWEQWKSWVYGEQGGVSSAPLSLNMLLPPAGEKVRQMIQGIGSSKEYAYWYNGIYMSEMAKHQAGLRDEPTAEEITKMTNNFQMLRILANLTAFTPPQYELAITPLVDAIRANDKRFGADGPWKSLEMYGPILATLGDYSTTKNIAGAFPYTDSVERAREYDYLLQQVAGDITDLSTLGMVLNGDPNSFYDESAYAWQFVTKIPGTNRTFRELQSPEQALKQARVNAGWTVWLQFKDHQQAILDQSGKTLRNSPDMMESQRNMLEKMRTDPLYEGWYEDKMDFGSTRTADTIKVMSTFLSDEKFVADNAGNPVWIAAYEYLNVRNEVIDILREAGGSIDAKKNIQIREFWDNYRNDLVKRYNGWGTFSERYLSNDDDPSPISGEFELEQPVMEGVQ